MKRIHNLSCRPRRRGGLTGGRRSERRSGALPAAPLGHEGLGLELGEVGAQRAREPAGLRRLGVPEQRHLARGDLHDLDVVEPAGPGQQRRPAAPAADAAARTRGSPSRRSAAPAASSPRSPWKTRPSGTARRARRARRRAAAAAVAASSRSGDRAEPRALGHRDGVHLARGGGDQHVVALGRGRARRRTPAGTRPARTPPRGRSASRRWRRAAPTPCRPGTGPASAPPAARGAARAPLDLRAEDLLLLGAAERADAAGRQARQPHGDPLRDLGQHVHHPLGGEVGLRRGEVVVEARLRQGLSRGSASRRRPARPP